MGIDNTFQPKTPTYIVDSSAAVVIDGRQDGVSSWRIQALGAAGAPGTPVAGIIKWAQGNAAAPAAPAAVVALGTPLPNTLAVNAGQTLYIEGIGAWLQFIGSVAFATGSFAVTGGQGGCGG
jgi:hypothetical protein